MAEDKRETILSRLHALAQELATDEGGDSRGDRNTANIPEKSRPAFIVMDGDEDVDEEANPRGRTRGSPSIMTMTPELHVFAAGDKAEVGPALSELRRKVIVKILTDASLVEAAHNGDIRYLGLASGFAAGRNMEATAALRFEIRYVLRPGSL